MDHSQIAGSCDGCHEDSRPSSAHPQSGDCSNCHSDPGGSWSGGSYDHFPPNPDCLGCHTFAANSAAIAPPVTAPDADTWGLLVGMVNDHNEAFWGDGLFHGDGALNYVDFEYYGSFLQASGALTIGARIRPAGIGTGNYATRILSRDSNRNYHLSVWRDSSFDPPGGVAAIAFWISPVNARGGSSWKPVLTDCAGYPILNDHWYLVKVVWNSGKAAGIPCDIFLDDEGMDGLGTEELWPGCRNATDSQQSHLPANRRLHEGDLIATGDGDFTIGANVNNHTRNNFIGEIDWIHWQARVDYSDVDDPPN